jgi:hypothetical protein
MNRRPVLRLVPLCAAGLLALAGCGGDKGTLSGKVTYQGKPVVLGYVSVIASDNVQYAGPINSDGSYSIPNVPGGPVKIAVSSPNPGAKPGSPAAAGEGRKVKGGTGDLPGEEAGPPGAAPAGWVALPEKYADPQTSGLANSVRGDTVINLDLT